MKNWLRRVTPDLFLAAVVALLLTFALNALDAVEDERIADEVRAVAQDGLTIDERITALERSIWRSTLLHLPLLAVAASIAIGLACRLRRWAWLFAIFAVIPNLLMGVSFFIDVPLLGSTVLATYVVLSAAVATSTVAMRRRALQAAAQGS